MTYAGRRDVENSWTGAGTNADWGAAGGVYVSPSGNLLLYGADYRTYDVGGAQTIRLIEYRNRNLNVQGSAPTGPWIEFYADDHLSGRSLILDNRDYGLEDREDVDQNDNFGDEADSLIFNAPPGFRIMRYEDQFFGGKALQLHGNGGVQVVNDLDAVSFGDKMHSVYTGTLAVPEMVIDIQFGLAFLSVLGGPTDQRTLSLRGGSYFAHTGAINQPVTFTTHGGTATIGN